MDHRLLFTYHFFQYTFQMIPLLAEWNVQKIKIGDADMETKINLYDMLDNLEDTDYISETRALAAFLYFAFILSTICIFTSVFVKDELNYRAHYAMQGLIVLCNCFVLGLYHHGPLKFIDATKDIGGLNSTYTEYYVAPVFVAISLGYTILLTLFMGMKYICNKNQVAQNKWNAMRIVGY